MYFFLIMNLLSELETFIISINKTRLLIWNLKWHTGIPGLWTQEFDAGLWTLDSGRWNLDAGPWTVDSERRELDCGHWMLDCRR